MELTRKQVVELIVEYYGWTVDDLRMRQRLVRVAMPLIDRNIGYYGLPTAERLLGGRLAILL